MTDKLTIALALNAAVLAGEAAALKVWARDKFQDAGSCGGAMLEFDRRSKVAKVAVEMKIARQDGDCFAQLATPPGIRSQNADIPQAQMRAFRQSLEAAGYAKAIKKFWTYVD